MKLYTSHNSTAAHRVRIALNLKGLPYDVEHVRMTGGYADASEVEFRSVNPQGMVPTLVDGHRVFTQSLAILEYLDESYPDPALIPGTNRDRQRIRSLAQVVACDVQPLTSQRTLAYLGERMGIGEELLAKWQKHWLDTGFGALEYLMRDNPASMVFCHGDVPTMADVCLVPQVRAAMDAGLDLKPYPTLKRIYETCMTFEQFQAAAPENQPDASQAGR